MLLSPIELNRQAIIPRFLLLKGKERKIEQNLHSHPRWTELHESTSAKCDVLMSPPRAKPVKIGRRMLTTSSTELPVNYDAPNPGAIRVGFEFELASRTSKRLVVQRIPQEPTGVQGDSRF